MKKIFYSAFALMVLGAAVLILTVPALLNAPSPMLISIAAVAGTLFVAASGVVVLLKNVATRES